MITFYEGLPRSGKSFSCMRDEIIPALQKGRKVFAYIEGLDHEKIAEVAGIEVEQCRELLHAVTREEVPRIYGVVANDSLVVLDEIQNFWPTQRQPIKDPEVTQFVTEHGHRGLDIVIMGQSLQDVHSLWRNRVEVKLYFLKRTALGKPDSYSCTLLRAVPRGDKITFLKVSTQNYTYEEKYFGTYKSHTDGTANKGTKVDPRGVIWNQPLFRRYLPAFGILLVVSVVYLWNTMHGGLEKGLIKNASAGQAPTAQAAPAATAQKTEDGHNGPIRMGLGDGAVPDTPKDLIQDLTEKNRIRLVATWRSGSTSNGLVEWRDAAGAALVQSMQFRDIEALGYTVFVNSASTLAFIVKGPIRYVASSWAVDRRDTVASDSTQRAVSGQGVITQGPSPITYRGNAESPALAQHSS